MTAAFPTRFIRITALCLIATCLLFAACVGGAPTSDGLTEGFIQAENFESAISRNSFNQSGFLPPPSLRFERITSEDGISSNAVTQIYQDSRGFLWIGTQDGLNKYDGVRYNIYRHDPEDSDSLRDNFIKTIYEDSSGTLWFGTQSGWLERFDRQKEQFTHFDIGVQILSILEDSSGAFWVGTLDPGLLLFDRTSGNTTLFWEARSIVAIYEDLHGAVWASSLDEGIGILDKEDSKLIIQQVDYPVSTFFEDSTDSLWFGTLGGGLGQLQEHMWDIVYTQNNPENPASISSNWISTIIEDNSGHLWVGTYDQGLNRFDRETGKFTRYSHQPANPYSISNNAVQTIHQDDSGVVWIGNDFGGLNKLSLAVLEFGQYSHIPDDPNSISAGIVTSIYEDHEGILWIGTLTGLNTWDRTTGIWQHYLHDSDDSKTLANDFVRSIYVDKLNNVWIGTEEGLDRFDRETGEFLHIPSPTVMWMIEDASDNFWLATKGGFYQLNRDTEEASLVREGFAWKIMVYEDDAGIIWLGSSGDGVDKFDPVTGEWHHYENDPDDPASLSGNFVEVIHQDHNGRLWFGTNSGLNLYDEANDFFSHYRVQDGLPHDYIFGILEDSQGNLWLSTGGGLSRFNPETGSFENFFISDGLQSNTFWRNAYYKSTDGAMFFGGENGLNAFHPDNIAKNTHLPPVVITSMSIFNEVRYKDLQNETQITLPYKENFLSFDFTTLDFTDPKRNQFAYHLYGIDKDWVLAGTRNHADYPDLRPGEYLFHVIGSNNDGLWNHEGAKLWITITPPFWSTWWFRSLLIILFISMLFGAYRINIRRIAARNLALEKQVEERTNELRSEIDQRVQAEQALLKSEREKAVAEERNRLARDLHDAVTQTLFSASLLAEAIPATWENDPEEAKSLLAELRLLSRGALAEMRALLLELRPAALADVKMNELLHQLIEAAAGREELAIELSVKEEAALPLDVHVAFYRIAQEALNNIIKHALANKVQVSYTARSRRDVEIKTADLIVKDDGIGFDPNLMLPERLGVGIMRERAVAIKAGLTIESQPGGGTRIHLHWNSENTEIEREGN